MPCTTLIPTAALSGDHNFAVIDTRFALANPDWGLAEYRVGHIPGAVYAQLDRDLSGPKRRWPSSSPSTAIWTKSTITWVLPRHFRPGTALPHKFYKAGGITSRQRLLVWGLTQQTPANP